MTASHTMQHREPSGEKRTLRLAWPRPLYPVAEQRFRFSHLVLEAITCSGVRSNAQEELERQEEVALGPEQGDTHENRHSSARIECTGTDHRPH